MLSSHPKIKKMAHYKLIENRTSSYDYSDSVRVVAFSSDSPEYIKSQMSSFESRIALEIARSTKGIYTNDSSLRVYVGKDLFCEIPLPQLSYNCNTYFCTLTYNDKFLPRLSPNAEIWSLMRNAEKNGDPLFQNLDSKSVECFNSDDLVRFTKGLKDEFQRSRKQKLFRKDNNGDYKYSELVSLFNSYLDNNVSLKASLPVGYEKYLSFDCYQFFNRPFKELKYIIVSECGENTHRPHYHIIFIAPSVIDSLSIHKLFRKHWSVTVKKNGKVERWESDGSHRDPYTHEVIEHICGSAKREMLGMIRPSVAEHNGNPSTGKKPFKLDIQNIGKVAKYVSKYVTKGSDFNSQSLLPCIKAVYKKKGRDVVDRKIEGISPYGDIMGEYYPVSSTRKNYIGESKFYGRVISVPCSSEVFHCKTIANKQSTNFLSKICVSRGIQKRDISKCRCQIKTSYRFGSCGEDVVKAGLDSVDFPVWFSTTFDYKKGNILEGFNYKCSLCFPRPFPKYNMTRLCYKMERRERIKNAEVKLNPLYHSLYESQSLLSFADPYGNRLSNGDYYSRYKYKYRRVPTDYAFVYSEYRFERSVADLKKQLVTFRNNLSLMTNDLGVDGLSTLLRRYIPGGVADPDFDYKKKCLQLLLKGKVKLTDDLIERATYYKIGLKDKAFPFMPYFAHLFRNSQSVGYKPVKSVKPTQWAIDNLQRCLAEDSKSALKFDFKAYTYRCKYVHDVHGVHLVDFEKTSWYSKYGVHLPSPKMFDADGSFSVLDFDRFEKYPLLNSVIKDLDNSGRLFFYAPTLENIKFIAKNTYMRAHTLIRDYEGIDNNVHSYDFYEKHGLLYNAYFFKEDIILSLMDMYDHYARSGRYKMMHTRDRNKARCRQIFADLGVDYKNFNQIV